MVCCEILTNIRFNYRFIDEDTVEIWDGEDYNQKISYRKWCQNYLIIDKWRDLTQYEINENKKIWKTYMSET